MPDSVSIEKWGEAQRKSGCAVVAVTGCFDLFHAGHADFLMSVKLLGGIRRHAVLVCIDSDKRVAFHKGHGRPIIPLAERVSVLRACRYADRVASFDSLPELNKILRELKPDYIGRNEDDRGKPVFGEDIAKHGVLWVKTPPIHTSDIIQRVLDSQD